MKVTVIYGGLSSEREVSLRSGKGVIAALKSKGYDVQPFQVDNESDWDKLTKLENPGIVFNVLHGGAGENGTVQALMDMNGIPYIGSGVSASALAMDKWRAKRLFDVVSIPVAKDELDTPSLVFAQNIDEFDLSYPVIVKPNREGSTIGLKKVWTEEELVEAVAYSGEYDQEVIVEECIEGREVTVAVWGEKGEEEALPVVEIVSKNELYDYNAKYTKGMSDHLVPAEFPEDVYRKIQEYAVLAHQVLGCRTYSRVDFIVKDGEPHILEVNTQPGMTETSLFPDAAKAAGFSYEELVVRLVELGLKNQQV